MDLYVNGGFLARCKSFDAVAGSRGVPPLSSYLGQDPEEAREFCEESGIHEPPGGHPPVEWLAATEGLATVMGLIAKIEADPDVIAYEGPANKPWDRGPDAEDVLLELREFEEVLEQLASAGVRWHLAVDL